MELVEVNNTNYAVYVHQQDENLPWLLMLHGFMGDHRVFEHLVEELFESCNPVTIDLLGHGKSSKPTDPKRYNEHKQINDIYRLVHTLNIFPLFLYGYSMGGRLALKTAFSTPELFKGLILESTTNGITDEQQRKERRHTDEQRAKQVESNYEDFLSKWEEAALFQSPLPADEILLSNYHNIHLDQDPQAMAASLRGFGTGSMTPETKYSSGFDGPTLLMAGSGDEKYRKINDRLTYFFSDVHLCFIEAGHRIHLDNPSALSNEINHHIDQNSFL
ncbi:alpha/beta fold hydrolase [Fodinibius salsisoli]|uniref:Alpha/beta fold hydrolase n=1 Tax=Fodinibius salsisoli TaxID=2820877 RepID=A0ABT3PN88_9BACT|nr:alpha/beta fold hydrolase [Fodinibius salsisoli]MCW9707384.1 alpha/beta fold hydrolase [Fodinibius salsisoli]